MRRFAPLAPSKRKRRALRKFVGAKSGAATYITAGLTVGSWSRIAAWLDSFYNYLQDLAVHKRRRRPYPKLMASNSVALEFLGMVADEQKGHTRPAAALRGINFARSLLGIPSLLLDPRTPLLLKGVLKYFGKNPKGARPFPDLAVIAIAQAWGRAKEWWKRMAALAIFLGFVSLLRGAGLLGTYRRGVTWLVGERELTNPRAPPKRHSGVLLLVPVRKTRQLQHTWVTIKGGHVTRMLARHLRWLRKQKPRPIFLFPARARGPKKGTWRPKRNKRMSTSSLLALIRQALREVCGLSKEQAARFTVHSLRVGGINYYRRLGVPLETRAQLADHLSLPSALRYQRLSPAEQIRVLSQAVGKGMAA